MTKERTPNQVLFEAWAELNFDTYGGDFRRDNYDGQYHGNLHTHSFGGRIQPNVAPTSMIYKAWEGGLNHGK